MGASKEDFTYQREYEERLEELAHVQRQRIKVLEETIKTMKDTQKNQQETIELLKK